MHADSKHTGRAIRLCICCCCRCRWRARLCQLAWGAERACRLRLGAVDLLVKAPEDRVLLNATAMVFVVVCLAGAADQVEVVQGDSQAKV